MIRNADLSIKGNGQHTFLFRQTSELGCKTLVLAASVSLPQCWHEVSQQLREYESTQSKYKEIVTNVLSTTLERNTVNGTPIHHARSFISCAWPKPWSARRRAMPKLRWVWWVDLSYGWPLGCKSSEEQIRFWQFSMITGQINTIFLHHRKGLQSWMSSSFARWGEGWGMFWYVLSTWDGAETL